MNYYYFFTLLTGFIYLGLIAPILLASASLQSQNQSHQSESVPVLKIISRRGRSSPDESAWEDAKPYTLFHTCDPDCSEKCDHDDEEAVCVKIVEVDPDGYFVEFPTTCEFNCINQCFENQLQILNKGNCRSALETNEIQPEHGNKMDEGDEDQDVDD